MLGWLASLDLQKSEASGIGSYTLLRNAWSQQIYRVVLQQLYLR